MVLTASTMLDLGTRAPAFTLPDTTGKSVSLRDFSSARALLVVFMCNHCPYVKHLRGGLAKLARDYQPKGLAVVGINANDAGKYPDDAPDKMPAEKRQAGYHFAYLYDADQQVAQAYHAACTPDFFLFDRQRKLAYRGQFDDSRPGNDKPVTGADLRKAIDAVLAGQSAPTPQLPSMGCNIKWKPGSEPAYFKGK